MSPSRLGLKPHFRRERTLESVCVVFSTEVKRTRTMRDEFDACTFRIDDTVREDVD